jgi:hypothetical protein
MATTKVKRLNMGHGCVVSTLLDTAGLQAEETSPWTLHSRRTSRVLFVRSSLVSRRQLWQIVYAKCVG